MADGITTYRPSHRVYYIKLKKMADGITTGFGLRIVRISITMYHPLIDYITLSPRKWQTA